ncbi:MAG: DNA repair protein RecN [Bacteroidaceae bacterium]|nr:DNA repair protein RecN [Bacteroidaceae bacterium]
MLTHLYIKNFTLIDTLDIDFHEGFSVITGETGAGKSIILGAINLLLGQRADSKQVKLGTQKCIIEATFTDSITNLPHSGTSLPPVGESEGVFDLDGREIILRRELTSSGKSRSFINDTPVPLTAMKAIGTQLIDIHSQHKNLLINDENFQLNVVDIIANNSKQLADYQKDFAAFQSLKHQLHQLQSTIAESKKDEDYLRFQQEKLSEIELHPGMQEELEQEQETLAHAEDIKNSLYEADNILSGDSRGYNTIDGLREVVKNLEGLLDVYPSIEDVYNRMNDAYEEIKDLSDEVSDAAESIDDDPAQLEKINDKLDKIYSLQKKYNKLTVEELIDYKNEIDEKLSHIDNFDDELAELNEAMQAALSKAKATADKLTATRKKAAEQVEKKMLELLVPLGIPKVQFKVDITESKELSKSGQDNVQFLFSANTSTALAPVSQVASGGEIARVMLSLKAMISGAVQLPTIIFDEIDTGVSGKIAEKMALIMADMGKQERQVISITHLPQIASKGSTHYKVLKEETESGTTSRMMLLTAEERITEIAQMLSGSDITEAAIQNAKELLG